MESCLRRLVVNSFALGALFGPLGGYLGWFVDSALFNQKAISYGWIGGWVLTTLSVAILLSRHSYARRPFLVSAAIQAMLSPILLIVMWSLPKAPPAHVSGFIGGLVGTMTGFICLQFVSGGSGKTHDQK